MSLTVQGIFGKVIIYKNKVNCFLMRRGSQNTDEWEVGILT